MVRMSDEHREKILQCIRENGPCSQTFVKKTTGFSFTTVRVEIAKLEAKEKISVKWIGHTMVLRVIDG